MKIFNPNISVIDSLNYKLGFCNNFISDEKFYREVREDVMRLVAKPSDAWEEFASSDLESAPQSYSFLGGGYDGSTAELLLHECKSLNLTALADLIRVLDTQDFADYIARSLDLSPMRLVGQDHVVGFLDWVRGDCVYLNLKLSAYPGSSGMALHRDNQRKRFGMLLYFGFTDQKTRAKGGTQFYSDLEAPSGWSEAQINHAFSQSDYLKLVHDHQPLANSFAAFEINNHSWHGIKVLRIESTGQAKRVNLQINFMRPRHKNILVKICQRIASLVK